jgi:hypothetical protein
VLLTYRWPAIPSSGIPTTTHQLAAHGLIALGLWLGLEYMSLTPGQRRATRLAIMTPDTLWFAVGWSAAINGVFRPATTPLPVPLSAIFRLPACDHRRAAVAVLEAGRAGARRVGSSGFNFTAYLAAGLKMDPGRVRAY